MPETNTPEGIKSLLADTIDHLDKTDNDKRNDQELDQRLQENVDAQIAELKQADRNDVREAAKLVATKKGIAAAEILSWVYGEEITTLGQSILDMAQRTGEEQFFKVIKGNSLEAHQITEKIAEILLLLGYENIVKNGMYGSVGNEPGAIALATKALQELLQTKLGHEWQKKSNPDKKFGSDTLMSLMKLLESQKEIRTKSIDEQRSSVEEFEATHEILVQELKSLFPENTSIEEMNIDLSDLNEFAGKIVNVQNTDGSSQNEAYDPKNILASKAYLGPEWARIIVNENAILSQVIYTLKAFRDIQPLPVDEQLEEGVRIWKYVSEAEVAGINIATESLKNIIQKNFSEIDSKQSLQDQFRAARQIWDELKPIKEEAVAEALQKTEKSEEERANPMSEKTAALEKSELTAALNNPIIKIADSELQKMVQQGLTIPNAIHWEEIKVLLPFDAIGSQEYLDQAVKNMSKNTREGETVPFNTLEQEITRLLNSINPRISKYDQLIEIFKIYHRSEVKETAREKVMEFLNKPETVDKVRFAFREVRGQETKDSKLDSTLIKLRALKRLYDAAPKEENATFTAITRLYTGEGNIDREMYGERGLIGRAFAKIENLPNTEAKLARGVEVMNTIPDKNSEAYIRAYQRFILLEGAASADVEPPSEKPDQKKERAQIFQETAEKWRTLKEKIQKGAGVVSQGVRKIFRRDGKQSGSGITEPKPSTIKTERTKLSETEGQLKEIPATLEVREGAPDMLIDITADRPLVWTSFRNTEGRTVVELPGYHLALESQEFDAGLITGIQIEKVYQGTRPMTRLVIPTRQEAEHSITAKGNKLQIILTPVASGTEPLVEAPIIEDQKINSKTFPTPETTQVDIPADPEVSMTPTELEQAITMKNIKMQQGEDGALFLSYEGGKALEPQVSERFGNIAIFFPKGKTETSLVSGIFPVNHIEIEKNKDGITLIIQSTTDLEVTSQEPGKIGLKAKVNLNSAETNGQTSEDMGTERIQKIIQDFNNSDYTYFDTETNKEYRLNARVQGTDFQMIDSRNNVVFSIPASGINSVEDMTNIATVNRPEILAAIKQKEAYEDTSRAFSIRDRGIPSNRNPNSN